MLPFVLPMHSSPLDNLVMQRNPSASPASTVIAWFFTTVKTTFIYLQACNLLVFDVKY